jgi:8-oxo-dGTP pyrophosphatase MutT (NUDIX family)
MHPPITVVSVVCWSAGEILLGLRDGGDASGVWCCPGGKADTPGGLREHACREVQEEVGLVIAPDDLVPLPAWREYTDEHGQIFACVYYATREPVKRSDLRCMEPDKFAGWSFWWPDRLPEHMFDGERRAIAAAHTFVML